MPVAEPTLEKIVSLIRAQPAITVRELARELGFSEERSVYYWLRKAGHRGLKTFKTEVLWERGRLDERDPPESDGSAAPGIVHEGARVYSPHVLTIATRAYEPWVRAGDELHVDPGAVPVNGDLVLVDLPGEADALRRCYSHAAELLFTHPSDPRHVHTAGEVTLKGVVVRLIRRRP